MSGTFKDASWFQENMYRCLPNGDVPPFFEEYVNNLQHLTMSKKILSTPQFASLNLAEQELIYFGKHVWQKGK